MHRMPGIPSWKEQHRNHMRQHTRKEKSLSLPTCISCPYETRFKHNLNRHKAKAHSTKEKKPKATKACPECGKSFPYQKKLTRHKKIHQTKDSPKVVQKVKSNIGFGTFVTTEKESTTQEFLCAQYRRSGKKTLNSF